MKVVFRADASLKIGSGHVMRCLTLADALRERGGETVFVSREHPGHLFQMIEQKGHRLIRLPAPSGLSSGSLAHEDWLGAMQEKDGKQVFSVLNGMDGCDWLIVDHYALDEQWEKPMRASARNIMSIDDLADRRHDCDILLDQNYYADMESRYANLVPPHCRMLLGPKYALLRPEFAEARCNLRVRDGGVGRILVFFGGSDLSNETAKALEAIKLLGRSDIAVDVVIGAANPHQKEIARLCAGLSGVKLYRQVSNMAELMSNSDLAIGAGGSATWERCALGLPALIVSLAKNQIAIAEGVQLAEAQIYLGTSDDVTVEVLAAQLRKLLETPRLLSSMSGRASQLVDMVGAERICKTLEEGA